MLRRWVGITMTLLVLFAFGGSARSVVHLTEHAGGDTPEPQAISTIELSPDAFTRAGDAALRLVQIGNPVRRPTPPDLSRAGEASFPGRLSLEVPEPGIGWADTWLPPGVYRLGLASDGFEVRLRARPLAPGATFDLPIELGTMSSPGGRFRAVLARRTVTLDPVGEGSSGGEGVTSSGLLAIRWGALLLEANLSAPPVRTIEGGGWRLARVPTLVSVEGETYLGLLEGEAIGAGAMEVRWVIEAGGDHRLRLERVRRRRFHAQHREAVARSGRLHIIAESQRTAGDEESAARTTFLAKSYEERAERFESQARALEGSSFEQVGRPRPAVAGGEIELSIVEREGRVIFTIDGPDGGAEFPLPK